MTEKMYRNVSDAPVAVHDSKGRHEVMPGKEVWLDRQPSMGSFICVETRKVSKKSDTKKEELRGETI